MICFHFEKDSFGAILCGLLNHTIIYIRLLPTVCLTTCSKNTAVIVCDGEEDFPNHQGDGAEEPDID